ncbi:unnamed protein product [Bursaphelenchus xylophilus]|uniref:(pine wood nematode) hypothetical protein n=1 Tax=Bursaphelenchus xylophilus TaxID=6326 RepID=A0A1I7SFV5_BURXY|nr:unnamed protein product [Bursaphelenchus xylophilus]CAG9106343.1 unnamed protein product [Bursaphelenchus xylophilus]
MNPDDDPDEKHTVVGHGIGHNHERFVILRMAHNPGRFSLIGLIYWEGQVFFGKVSQKKRSHFKQVEMLMTLTKKYFNREIKEKVAPLLYDHGPIYGKDQRYIAMEMMWYDCDAPRRICDARYTVQSTLRLAIKQVRALQRAHECGIVVRDIKHDNFCFSQPNRDEPSDWDVFVVDFGNASYFQPEFCVSFEELGKRFRCNPKAIRFNLRSPRVLCYSYNAYTPYDDMEQWLYYIAKAKCPYDVLFDGLFEEKDMYRMEQYFSSYFRGVYHVMCRVKREEPFPYDEVVRALEESLTYVQSCDGSKEKGELMVVQKDYQVKRITKVLPSHQMIW